MSFGDFLRALRRPQILRTCTECSYSWRVARYYTKHHVLSGPSTSSGGPRGYEQSSPMPLMATGTDQQRIRNQSEEWVEHKAKLGTCPRCGSTRLTQQRLWSESKADFDGDDD